MDYHYIKEFLDECIGTIFGRFISFDVILGKYKYMSVETLLKKCDDFAKNDYQNQFYLASAALIEKVADSMAVSLDILEKENIELKEENIRLKKENEEMKLHIMVSPGGEIYLEAQEDFYKYNIDRFK